jgi:hypothetical protein
MGSSGINLHLSAIAGYLAAMDSISQVAAGLGAHVYVETLDHLSDQDRALRRCDDIRE